MNILGQIILLDLNISWLQRYLLYHYESAPCILECYGDISIHNSNQQASGVGFIALELVYYICALR